MAANTLPAFSFDEELNVADFPLHLMDVRTHQCVFCGLQPTGESYQDYLEWWLANEYEGEPGHQPWTEELWNALDVTCTGF
ncbi:hypothetical protein SEA_CECE_345 [Microbacterium phage Cece]|nr:hypothetical protein SEA_CECE_43 [Microbacterium phage Cece]UVG35351.1 hypothetical protein SEA_CECE_345 [Microbacterium phage Cece]